MSATGLDVFDTTLQKTNNWLNDLMQVLRWPDKHKVYVAFRATLHALRDRLTVEEVAHLGAQLPMLVRGFYYESWDPTGKPLKQRHKEQFLARIEQQFKDDDDIDPSGSPAQSSGCWQRASPKARSKTSSIYCRPRYGIFGPELSGTYESIDVHH